MLLVVLKALAYADTEAKHRFKRATGGGIRRSEKGTFPAHTVETGEDEADNQSKQEGSSNP